MSDIAEKVIPKSPVLAKLGYVWVKYNDGSGHLKAPNGEKYCNYDLNTREYKNPYDKFSGYSVFSSPEDPLVDKDGNPISPFDYMEKQMISYDHEYIVNSGILYAKFFADGLISNGKENAEELIDLISPIADEFLYRMDDIGALKTRLADKSQDWITEKMAEVMDKIPKREKMLMVVRELEKHGDKLEYFLILLEEFKDEYEAYLEMLKLNSFDISKQAEEEEEEEEEIE